MSFMNYKQSLYERKHEADMLAECSRPKSFDQSRNVMYTLSCEGVKVKTREGKSKKAYPCISTQKQNLMGQLRLATSFILAHYSIHPTDSLHPVVERIWMHMEPASTLLITLTAGLLIMVNQLATTVQIHKYMTRQCMPTMSAVSSPCFSAYSIIKKNCLQKLHGQVQTGQAINVYAKSFYQPSSHI
jgi:hypothetical protein